MQEQFNEVFTKYHEVITWSVYGTAIILMLIGLYAILIKKNLVKIIIGLTILDAGVHLTFCRNRICPKWYSSQSFHQEMRMLPTEW